MSPSRGFGAFIAKRDWVEEMRLGEVCNEAIFLVAGVVGTSLVFHKFPNRGIYDEWESIPAFLEAFMLYVIIHITRAIVLVVPARCLPLSL